MTQSPREPMPVPVRAYRYSRLRWRILVRVVDALGAVALALWRVFRRAPKVHDPRRILLVQLDHLGDAVLTSPMFPRLKAAYPHARIDVLASGSNHAVFEADPVVDRVWIADRNWFERRPGGFALGSAVWALGRRLRRERYDLGIDVRGDVLSILVLALAGVRRRVGWAMGGGGFLLTDIAHWVPERHEVRSRLALLERLGIDAADPVRVLVHVGDEDRARVAARLRAEWRETVPVGARASRAATTARRVHRRLPTSLGHGRFDDEPPLIAVHLGAGTAAKRWPASHWRRLIERLLHDGRRVVVVGGKDDVEWSRPLEPHPLLRDWSGRLSVTETAALLERADLFIGADSGPAHIAAAAGVPSLVLFSGTNRPAQWRPWSRRSLVLKERVRCSPCHRKVCPLADHPCLTGITPDRVHRAAHRWVSRNTGASHDTR